MEKLKSPKISIVVIVYNMQREAKRTLYSLSSAYQGVSEEEYEVLVVENGSTKRLKERDVNHYGKNFHYHFLKDAPPSLGMTVNYGVQHAKGEMVGIMIDGARILTPGIVRYALRALKAYQNPCVSTLGWHLGDEMHHIAFEKGYNQKAEDALLKSVNWEEDGYRLFRISTLAASSSNGWFLPIAESNCFFLRKDAFEQLGGFDEAFSAPGGGFINLDFYKRMVEFEGIEPIILLGEGSFHQIHGGAATGISRDDPKRQYWIEQYQAIRGEAFRRPEITPEYWGHFPKEAGKFVEKSFHTWLKVFQASQKS